MSSPIYSSGITPNLPFEVIRTDVPRGGFRAAIFDFDGTLSLIREDWPDAMIPMMVELLQQTGTTESATKLRAIVEEYVMRLNGRPTIDQMRQLASEIEARHGKALEPEAYKRLYHVRLMQRVEPRIAELEAGAPPVKWALPGTHALLDNLRVRGVKLYLASGTDEEFVRRECALLDLTRYFEPHIYAATARAPFSKQAVVERLLEMEGLTGAELLGFGDGVVETEVVRGVGGVAIAVAYDSAAPGQVNAWKRSRLVAAGADVVIPEYRCRETLLNWLFAGP